MDVHRNEYGIYGNSQCCKGKRHFLFAEADKIDGGFCDTSSDGNYDDDAEVSVDAVGDGDGDASKREKQGCTLKVNDVGVEKSGTEYGKMAGNAEENVRECAGLVRMDRKRGEGVRMICFQLAPVLH